MRSTPHPARSVDRGIVTGFSWTGERPLNAHAFLVNLSLVLGVAAVATVVFQRIRQPVVLGYILAGLIVGPYTSVPLVADHAVVDALAELGVILLMFGIGLEFRLSKVAQIASTGGVIALIEVSVMGALGYAVGKLFGWTPLESLFTGAVVAISSTSIIAKAFEEQQVSRERRELVFGVLIAEDLLAILMMAALTILASGRDPTIVELGTEAVRLGLSLVALLIAGLAVVPRAFRLVVGLKRPETITVAAVGLCFAVALATRSLGYSEALGAFLAGMLIAESGHGNEVEHRVRPVRDVFAAIFFVAVGMLIDPALVLEHALPIVCLTAVVLVGKVVAVSLGAFLVGSGTRSSVAAGMSLAQIGEFSFIIAGLGVSLGAVGSFLYPVAIAVSAVTAFTTPAFIRAADRVADRVDHKLPAPLQTLTSVYAAWLEELRTQPAPAGRRARARRVVQVLVADAGLLLALAAGHALFSAALARALATTGLGEAQARWTIGVVVLLLAIPACAGVLVTGGRLGGVLAEGLSDTGSSAQGFTARRTLVAVVRMGVLLAVGLPLVALTLPLLPTSSGPILLFVLASTLAVSVWRGASQLQGELRSGPERIFASLREPSRSAASDGVPSLAFPHIHTLAPQDGAVGATLIDLNLRSLTGATVLAVTRADSPDAAEVPSAHEPLHAGDQLALAGTREAVDQAIALLRSHRPTEAGIASR